MLKSIKLTVLRNGILVSMLMLLSTASLGAQQKSGPPVNANAAIAAKFEQNVANYMRVRQKAMAGLSVPKNTDSPAKIAEFQKQLAANIRALRANAVGLFRNLVAIAMRGRDGALIRTSFEHAEPIQGVRFDVNAAYPDGLPLQSMPPSLLLNLPQLSKELEYRFVGRELILRDAPANLIVDVIPDLSIP